MRCPGCKEGQELKEAWRGDTKVYICEFCKGIWLHADGLNAINPHSVDFDRLLSPQAIEKFRN